MYPGMIGELGISNAVKAGKPADTEDAGLQDALKASWLSRTSMPLGNVWLENRYKGSVFTISLLSLLGLL